MSTYGASAVHVEVKRELLHLVDETFCRIISLKFEYSFSKQDTMSHCCFIIGFASVTLTQHYANASSTHVFVGATALIWGTNQTYAHTQ